VDLTHDDRATILGALLWMADKLQSDQGERARALWATKGKQAFENDSKRGASMYAEPTISLGLSPHAWCVDLQATTACMSADRIDVPRYFSLCGCTVEASYISEVEAFRNLALRC
jgi:hypothetical protein